LPAAPRRKSSGPRHHLRPRSRWSRERRPSAPDETLRALCRGLVWPADVAPFQVHLVRLGADAAVAAAADKLYDQLTKDGVEVLYDDRDESAGAKFADADLMGLPVRLTVSKKTLEQDAVEYKRRRESDSKLVKQSDLAGILVANV